MADNAFCRKCGHPMRDPDDRFCGRCGAQYEGSGTARIDPLAPTMLGVVPGGARDPRNESADPVPLVRTSRPSDRPVRLVGLDEAPSAPARPIRIAGIDDPVKLPRPWWSAIITFFKTLFVMAILLGVAAAVLWFVFPDELYDGVDRLGLDWIIRLPPR